MKGISDLRKEYTKASLDGSSVDKNPLNQFKIWLQEAIATEEPEPNAMVLSTLSDSGSPHARVVLLKGLENGKFLLYTNLQSQKGKELDNNPACCLTFFWASQERQIRISGVAERVEGKQAEIYFNSRPRDSQIGAWASPQSAVIKDRSILEGRAKEIADRYKDMDIPKPHQWGGFAIVPHEIEFWQGRVARLHDRILYTLIDGEWKINRLAP